MFMPFKSLNWYGVEPLPNAFVINIGFQLQNMSNGNSSANYRVITNTTTTKTILATFISPTKQGLIEPPAKAFISRCPKCMVNQGDPDGALKACSPTSLIIRNCLLLFLLSIHVMF